MAIALTIVPCRVDHAFDDGDQVICRSRGLTALVAVIGEQEEQVFATAGTGAMRWVHRPSTATTDPAPMLDALADIVLGPETFAWVATEGAVAHAIRGRLIERGHPPGWIKASGYWVAGTADSHLKLN